MIHDFGPEMLTLFGALRLQWFGSFVFVGVIVSAWFASWIAHRQNAGFSQALVGSALSWMFIGSLLGGRIGYGLFYDTNMFFRFRPEFPVWGLLAFSEGGLSWHGAVLGALVASIFFAHRSGLSQMYILDLTAWVAPLLLFFSRLGSYFSAELLGAVSSAPTPIAFKYPAEILRWPEEVPEKFAQISDLGSAQEIFNRFQAGDLALQTQVLPLLEFRYPFALISALAEGLLVFILLFLIWKSSRKPGMVTSAYLFFTAMAGFAVSTFEWIDASKNPSLLSFSLYQWICLFTALWALIFYVLWVRSRSMSIPGWSRGANIRIHRRN